MVAYSFRSRFVEPIRLGHKQHTIRNDRKRHAEPGETLQLYTAMRTRQCRLIGTATCYFVCQITIDFVHLRVDRAGEILQTREERDRFAVSDGFNNWTDLMQWWREDRTNRTTHRNHSPMQTFSGVIIEWRDFVDAWDAIAA